MNHRFDESTFRRQRKRPRIEENEENVNEDNEEAVGGDDGGEENGEDEEETADLGYEIIFIAKLHMLRRPCKRNPGFFVSTGCVSRSSTMFCRVEITN